MQEIYIENFEPIIHNKNRLEKELGVKITNKGKLIFVEGEGEKEYLALKVFEAIDLDFSIQRALLLKDENIILQTLHIKDLTKRKDLQVIKSRLIGTRGKTLKNLCHLTDCLISLKDNSMGIIGESESMEYAIQAITSIIKGSKQANVYARLEREKKNRRSNPKNYLNIKNELDRE
jgi:ribosomal RNA assembly protein